MAGSTRNKSPREEDIKLAIAEIRELVTKMVSSYGLNKSEQMLVFARVFADLTTSVARKQIKSEQRISRMLEEEKRQS